EAAVRPVDVFQHDLRPRAVYAVLLRGPDVEPPARDREPSQAGPERALIEADVEQRPEQHVARGAAEAVEIRGSTHATQRLPRFGRRLAPGPRRLLCYPYTR